MYHGVNKRKNGKVTDEVSFYQPSKKVKETIAFVQSDMQTGRDNLNRGYPEFNDRSVIAEINLNQKNFNSYIPPKSDDPDESWRAQTVRPVTRNKLISIAAHVLAAMIYPTVFAQNDRDEEDIDSAIVMRDLIEWVIDNSNYSMTFLQSVISALTDPATIVEAEFAKVMRNVKEMKEDGTYTMKEIIDEIFSGFQYHLIMCNEFYIANPYEPNVQKQRFVARRKLMDYEEAKLIFGKEKNFKYVNPGVRAVFDVDSQMFYDQADVDLEGNNVEVVYYYNHSKDLKLTFVNGVLMCDPEYPNPRNDKKYPFAKTGYEILRNGQFFWYKSAANKLSSDQELIDTMYNMVMDGTFLSLMPPMALYGSEDINSSVMVPGTITGFMDKDTRLESIAPRMDIRGGLQALDVIERSMSESSQDNQRSGVAENTGEKTAYEVSTLEKNAQIALGLFGKMIGFFVTELGQLMVQDILQHLTVGEVADITSSGGRMKFMNFILPEKIEDGKKVTKRIQFSEEMIGQENLTDDEILDKSFKIMDEEGGYGSSVRISKVNPNTFREIKFKVKVAPDVLQPKNKQLEKALNLEAYDRLIQNPLVDQNLVTRDFLVEQYKPGESDKYMKKMEMGVPPEVMAEGVMAKTPNKQKGVNTNMIGQMTGNNSLKDLTQ